MFRFGVMTASALICLAPAAARQVDHAVPDGPFDEAWRICKDEFYSASMHGADWEAIRRELLPRARAAASAAQTSAVINEALSHLHASHTAHYFQDQREYYELLDVFFPDGVPKKLEAQIAPGPVRYVGIGLATRTIDGHLFAAEVYDTGPAAQAGILPGDELISVEGGPWGDVAPFRGREGKPTAVTIQRTPDASSRRDLTVTPALIRPRELFAAAVTGSVRIIERAGKKVGYIRVLSYSSPVYHEAVKDALAGPLAAADALVLDIRGGWGGASPSYMDIFNPTAPSLTLIGREGDKSVFSPAWRKPVAMLIDGGSRSGKEVLAFAFKKHKLGLLVGERTAGAVLAGSPRPLADGSLLYLAVGDVLVDGQSLEGAGVEPDIRVERRLPYSEGADAQLDAAVQALTGGAGRATPNAPEKP